MDKPQTIIVDAKISEAVGAEPGGFAWDVTIIGPEGQDGLVTVDGASYVRSKNKRLYACDALRESVPQWEGVKVYDNHLTDEEFEQRGGMRSVASEWVGTIRSPRWDESRHALCGVLKIVDESLARKLKLAWDQGELETIGLSIDTFPIDREVVIEGARFPATVGFGRIVSVDIVADPAAGGRFNRLIASVQNDGGVPMPENENGTETQEQGMEITPEFEEYLKGMIAQVVADALAAAAAPAEEPPMEAAPEVEAEIEPEPEAEPATVAPGVQAQVQKLECKIMLRDKLDAAKLGALRPVVESVFAGRIFEEVELTAAIKRAKEAQASMTGGGQVQGAGSGRGNISVGMAPRDFAEVEFMRLVMGNSAFRALENAETDYVRDRIGESYKTWVKSGRERYGTIKVSNWAYELMGNDPAPLGFGRAKESVTTSTMSSIVKNTVNIMLAADYAKKHEWWAPIVREEEVDTIDDATLVRIFGLSTLSSVAEGGPYTELEWADEEETASMQKRGNFVGVTMETLLKDKIGVIRSLPARLSTSWYNTLSGLVSAVFTTNTATGPVLADSGALFNATAVGSATGHANLLTTALSFAAYDAARTAMLKQTDQPLGAGQKLLIEPKFMLVPVDLETTALQIRNSQYYPGSMDNDVNPHYQKFEVVKVPNWTDTNNWALVADPAEFPAIWMLYLRGHRVPELYTADDESAGALFTNDTFRYKVRMWSFRYSSTYDCAPVSDFRPLHKSNV